MGITLTICSWLLVALGIAMTGWLYPHPWAFLSYLLFPFAIISARRVSIRAVVLVLTLLAVCVAFWVFWDALVRPSTLNRIPFEIVMAESLVAGATWLVVRRIKRCSICTPRGY